MFRLMINIGAMQDLYASRFASTNLRKANLPSPSVEGEISGAVVTRIRHSETADNGRQRFLLLLTEEGQDDHRAFLQETLEDKASSILDVLMLASSKSEVQNEIRTLHSICEALDDGSAGPKRNKDTKTELSRDGSRKLPHKAEKKAIPLSTTQKPKARAEPTQPPTKTQRGLRNWPIGLAIVTSITAMFVSTVSWNSVSRVDRNLDLIEGSLDGLGLGQRLERVSGDVSNFEAMVQALAPTLEGIERRTMTLEQSGRAVSEALANTQVQIDQISVWLTDFGETRQLLNDLNDGVAIQNERFNSLIAEIDRLESEITTTNTETVTTVIPELIAKLEDSKASLSRLDELQTELLEKLQPSLGRLETLGGVASSITDLTENTQRALSEFEVGFRNLGDRSDAIDTYFSSITPEIESIKASASALEVIIQSAASEEPLDQSDIDRLVTLVLQIQSNVTQLNAAANIAAASGRVSATHLVRASLANLREGPSTNFEPVTTLMSGTELQLLARQGDWGRFLVLSGKDEDTRGWMSLSLTRELEAN